MIGNILTEQACEQLRTLVVCARHIVCTCHHNPDGDAVGSCLAWAAVIKALGGEAEVIIPDQMPDFLTWMPGVQTITRYDRHRQGCDFVLSHCDLLCCLDFNAADRTGDMEAAINACPAKKLMIDHHLDPQLQTVLSVSHPDASSTCELVFRVAWQLGVMPLLGKDFAAPLYCGMMTDTGGFTYGSTNPEIYFIISELLAKGINKDKIYRHVFHTFSENRLRLTGYVLYEKLVVDARRHASYFTITRADMQLFHFIKGDAEGLVNMPLQMKGHKLSISLREDSEKDNAVWVSLRSVDDFPCNEMAARFFNGGGHLNASGGRLYCSIEEAEQVAKAAIEAFEERLIN